MEWMTKDMNGHLLCNFTLKVLSVDEVRFDGVGERIPRVKVCIDFEGKDTANQKICEISLGEIDKTCWKNLNIRCRYHPEVSESKVERYLGSMIRDQIEKAPRRLVERLTYAGMHKLDSQLVFCTGNDVIQDSSKAKRIIEIASLEENLDIDVELKECDAARGIIDLISLSSEAGRALLAYKLGHFMRVAYEEVGKMPRGCIYLYGKTGIQKTTFSSLLIQTYDRNSGIKSPSRLNASIPAAVNMLLESPNDVVVMDDLFPADSKKIRGQQEEMLIEITRYIADGTVPARMRGKKLSQESPKCGVIFTGEEELIGRGSDAARLLSVKMDKPNTKELRYFQERPLIVSTFYRNYITWFIYNYDEICGILEQLREKYEKIAPCVHDRLREMYFFLGSSYFLFLQYLVEKKILPETDARRLYLAFDELLVMLVEQQNERVMGNQSTKSEQEDFLQRIRILYKTKQMSIADDVETFDKELHDGVFHRNKLYLRGERVPVYFPGSTIEDIADSLEAQGALETGKKGRTKQISRLKGMRFYVVIL